MESYNIGRYFLLFYCYFSFIRYDLQKSYAELYEAFLTERISSYAIEFETRFQIQTMPLCFGLGKDMTPIFLSTPALDKS